MGDPSLGLPRRRALEAARMKRPFLLLAGLLLGGLSACTNHLQQKENFLREAGFRTVTPTTPAQIERAKAMPQGHIQKITRNGKTLFVLSDAKKNLLLIGGDPQLQRYQQILYTKQVDPEIENRAYDKALEYDGFGWGGMMDPFFGMPMMMY
jgi:hypothetical protein